MRKQSVIELGREYHGTGYMSAPLDMSRFQPATCFGGWAIAIAFSDGQGGWDSLNGANYMFSEGEFDGHNPAHAHFNSQQSTYNGVNLAVWDFIVAEMRK